MTLFMTKMYYNNININFILAFFLILDTLLSILIIKDMQLNQSNKLSRIK